jgi:hypothetical protein
MAVVGRAYAGAPARRKAKRYGRWPPEISLRASLELPMRSW